MGKVQKFEWRCDGYDPHKPDDKVRCPHTEITSDDQPPPGWNYVYTMTGRNAESRIGKSRTSVCPDCATRLRVAANTAVRLGGWDHAHTTEAVVP